MTREPGSIVIGPRGAGHAAVSWQSDGLDVAAAWRALRAAFQAEAEMAPTQSAGESAKLFHQGRAVTEPHRWPHRADAAAEPWTWATQFADESYFVWARAIQTYDRPLFEAIVEAAATAFGRRGLHTGPVEAEVFLGDYGFTPGGIHRESCANLHLVVHGAKNMYYWPANGWPPAGTPRRVDVASGTGTREEYLADLDPATVLHAADSQTACAGRGFAWDAGTWHVGETRGPALAVNIAAYQRGLRPEQPFPLWGDHVDGEVPAGWLAGYQDHLGQPGAPADLLARVSALGLRPAPPTRRPRRGRRARWRLAVPVLWRIVGAELLIATLGSTRSFRPAGALIDWLATPRRPGVEVEIRPELDPLAGWLHGQGVLDIMADYAEPAGPTDATRHPTEGR